jgi:hypothetical protein
VNEPFGYSIFNAIDYGKLPILNKFWLPKVDYKYRANTKEQFNEIYEIMCNDFEVERQYNFNKLKEALLVYDNKMEWVKSIVNLLNK